MYKEKYIPYPEIMKMVKESNNNQNLKILLNELLQKLKISITYLPDDYWMAATILNKISNEQLLKERKEIYFYYLLSKK